MPSQKPTILLLNGPNLNLLGTREPQIYGSTTLSDVQERCLALASSLDVELRHVQSNHEGALVDAIHALRRDLPLAGVVINPGAFTHTSVAIRDALLGVGAPFVELHVSNVHAREAFRHHSYLSDKAVAVICGMGVDGYAVAVEFMAKRLKSQAAAKL